MRYLILDARTTGTNTKLAQNLIFILPDIVKRLDFQQRPDISQL